MQSIVMQHSQKNPILHFVSRRIPICSISGRRCWHGCKRPIAEAPTVHGLSIGPRHVIFSIRRRLGHTWVGWPHGRRVRTQRKSQPPHVAQCVCGRVVVPTRRICANLPVSRRFIATWVLRYAIKKEPNDASASIVAGKPIWPRACKKFVASRTEVSRRAGCVLGAESAYWFPPHSCGVPDERLSSKDGILPASHCALAVPTRQNTIRLTGLPYPLSFHRSGLMLGGQCWRRGKPRPPTTGQRPIHGGRYDWDGDIESAHR